MKRILITTIAAVLLVGTAFADPIHDAVNIGDIGDVQAELDAGADVNAKDEDDETPLDWAIKYMTAKTEYKHTTKPPTSSANTAARQVRNWKLTHKPIFT